MKKRILLFIMITALMVNHYAFAQKGKDITIAITGDVMLDRSIGKMIEIHGEDYPWINVSKILKESDLTLINLETSIGVSGKAISDKSYTFQSKPRTLKGVVNAGIDGTTIANNHVLDFGENGFIETLENLEKMDIQYTGGGRNIQDALRPALWEINGIKIGCLAFSRVIPDVNWYATNKRAGITSAYDHYADQVCKVINETKEEVDFLIVSVHWGKELKDYPEEKDIKFAKKLIDSGADCIMGHHPHVLQGVEFYKDKPIVYSLGNFVFNAKGKKSNQTMIFHMEINKNGIINTKITPILIKNGQPTPVKGKEKEEIINILNTLSRRWNIRFLPNGYIQGNINYVQQKKKKLNTDIKIKIEDINPDKEDYTETEKIGLKEVLKYAFVENPIEMIRNIFGL